MSGGLLLDIRDSVMEVGAIDKGSSNFKFEYIGVYGPADHSRSSVFLKELEAKVSSSNYPVVVGGISI